uniref:SAYSvFN domain-containing protein n=1 Tax=Steinernema glaseri TaxID=37863 RepID=A0A1I8ADJ3_9BILA
MMSKSRSQIVVFITDHNRSPSLSTTHIDSSPTSRRTQSSSTMSAIPIPRAAYRRQSVDSAVVVGSPTRRFFESFREKMHLRSRRSSHRDDPDQVDPLELGDIGSLVTLVVLVVIRFFGLTSGLCESRRSTFGNRDPGSGTREYFERFRDGTAKTVRSQ